MAPILPRIVSAYMATRVVAARYACDVTPIAPPPKPFPYWVLAIPAGVLALLLTLFLAVWQFLTPSERLVQVAYSDFIAEVHAGRVDEIKIHDREIRYRAHTSDGGTVTRGTTGPIPDEALIESLKPTDPSAPLPKIYFER
jgi:ATP-dependent Zn protease